LIVLVPHMLRCGIRVFRTVQHGTAAMAEGGAVPWLWLHARRVPCGSEAAGDRGQGWVVEGGVAGNGEMSWGWKSRWLDGDCGRAFGKWEMHTLSFV
jgi:hypothetical protein